MADERFGRGAIFLWGKGYIWKYGVYLFNMIRMKELIEGVDVSGRVFVSVDIQPEYADYFGYDVGGIC